MIRVVRAHLNVDAQTHAGMTGKNNEDRYAVASFVLDKRDRTPVVFAVLADGIGGHRAGERDATNESPERDSGDGQARHARASSAEANRESAPCSLEATTRS